MRGATGAGFGDRFTERANKLRRSWAINFDSFRLINFLLPNFYFYCLLLGLIKTISVHFRLFLATEYYQSLGQLTLAANAIDTLSYHTI